MNLKLVIIHLDMVIESMELEPGEYTVGRGQESNILIQHLSLRPDHGRILHDDSTWVYVDNETGEKTVLDDFNKLEVTEQIGLATQGFVEKETVSLGSLSEAQGAHKAKLRQRFALVCTGVVTLLIGLFVGYGLIRSQAPELQQDQLVQRVRDKIVEFEVRRNDQAIEQLKKYAHLKDSDFKENSGFCTGFLVGPNIVLTAAHCMMGALVIDLNNNFNLKTADGKSHSIKRVLGFDVKRDYLFLETENMEAYGHLNFAKTYAVQQKVYTVGNVHGEGIAIRDGIISSETADQDEPDIKFLRYSAGTSPGNSGGPLLDQNGDVVALVFAATNSENFNMGTPARDLKKAYAQFVEGEREEQKIELAMKRVLNFKPSLMLQALSFPYLPQFDEYPEVSQAFNDVSIQVSVPVAFEDVGQVVLESLNQAVTKTFNEVQSLLKEKNEIVLDWKSFVSEETPAILPSQFDVSQSVFVKKGDRYYPMVAGLIDSPSKADFTKYKEQLEKEKKFDFQAYGYNIEQVSKKIDLLGSDIFYKPKNESGSIERLQSLGFGSPYSQLLIYGKDDLRTKGFFGIRMILKNFLADEGVLSTVTSRFIRPASQKDFTLKELEITKDQVNTEQVTDRLGRPWTREWIQIFETTHIVSYCTEMPEGVFCVARLLLVENESLVKIIEKNFRDFVLSHLLVNPYFWEKQQLVNYLQDKKGKSFPLIDGVELSVDDDQIKGSLDGFPFQFEIPESEKVQSIRLQTGLLYRGESDVDWTGFGIEWVQKEKEKDLICGLGVEVFESQSAFMLNFLRDRRKQEKLRKIKGEESKPLPGVWYKPFRGLKTPFQAYGYCAPLQEDPRVSGQYFVNFKNSKPLKYKYNIAN